ncbi:hypothetical protein [Micromonospora sp. KC213]|uniref:hypothetical protein n=1 Tax=Micromonospora sp. KC213 TaxID=2530378 RepID=UPI00104FEDE3|nr:hypothetical protein [Micromonospora sp. KC213]TDC42099.1 hypothetical protein E1166_09075 [Micromonospora sp. KC213]
MTSAPDNLLAVRRLLLGGLGPHGLASAEVGIVGDPAHRGGYHCGSDRVVTGDYSVVESPRDSTGLTLHASALDVGTFSVRAGGRTHNLMSFSTWCVAQCAADTPDSRDIREIIYSPDGRVVRRWDRLGRRSTGDSSHLWHTHFSFFRDSTKAGRDQTPLFRRYLTTIGLLKAPIPEADLTPEEHEWLRDVRNALLDPNLGFATTPGQPKRSLRQLQLDLAWVFINGPASSGAWVGGALSRIAEAAGISPAELEQIADAAREGAAEAAAAALAQLTPEAIATAIPPTMAKQVVDELNRRLAA